MVRKFITVIASIISFGVYAQGPYVLTKPMSAERIGCWANSFSDYDEIVGYSNLGHFFLAVQEKQRIYRSTPLQEIREILRGVQRRSSLQESHS